jgi:hypothetical protein
VTACANPTFFLMRTLLLVALLGSGVSLQAQPVREPKPDGRRLRLGTDSLEVFIVRQRQWQRTGTIVDRLDTIRVDGELRLQRVYRRTDTVLGNGVDTLVDHFPDLAPRSVQSRSDGGGTERLTWSAGRVTGTLEQPAKEKQSIDTTVAPSLYSSASFDLILRASPLAEGYEITVSAYSARRGATMLTAKVIGAETLAGLGDTWRVDANFGGISVTFWIARTSRRLIREIVRVSPEIEFVFAVAR